MNHNDFQALIDKLLKRYAHIIGDEHKTNPSLERIIENIVDYYETIIRNMPGNVYWLDENCIAVGCNQNTLDLFGFTSQEQFKGLTYAEMGKIGNWSDEAIANFNEDAMFVIKNGLPLVNREDFPIPNATGRLSYFLTNRVPIINQASQFVGMIGISVDITELKQMQTALQEAKDKAEASNRVKSQFLAVINHELRTPLVSILGLIDFLKQVDLPAREEKNILAAIKNCTHHLLALVNDVSDFNKLENGKYNVRFDPVNLDAIFYEVYGILKDLAKNKGLELRIHSSPNIPKTVLTDARILRQILINLVSNAIKFTDEGHITIRIRNLKEEGNRAVLEFSVIDTGVGIPPDKLKVVFEPFQQLEDAYTRQSSRSGTGLGLTIVAKLARLINAKISLESVVGQGSNFTVTGEFQIASEEKKDHKNIRKLKDYKDAKTKPVTTPKTLKIRPRVLLIEDDPIVQYVHTKMLTDIGCDVQVAASGQEAIGKLTYHDIVFVDISLPDMNGFEVIKNMRDQRSDLPIIALTVYTGLEEKNASLEAGANEFESKPISQSRFHKILLKYLGEDQHLPIEKKEMM